MIERSGVYDKKIDLIITLINSIQTEKEQREWLEKRLPIEKVEQLYTKPEEQMLALDREFIHLSKSVKELVGEPISNPEVQELMERYLQISINFVGKEEIDSIAHLASEDISELESMIPSPFTEEEEEWLQQAMEYYMTQQGLDFPSIGLGDHLKKEKD